MRFFPLMTALVVSLTLYMLVMERDRLLAFAGVETTGPEEVVAAAAVRPEGRRVPVRVQASEARNINTRIVLRGRTQATRHVEVRAETAGRVVSEPLRKGGFVEEDEVLCRLDPGTRQAALEEAEARLEEARINNRVAEDLAERGFGAENRAVSSRAGLQAAEAAVQRARREMELLTIRAPFAGLLETDTAERGTLMQPGAACASLVVLDPIRFIGFLPEIHVDSVAPGAMAGARLLSGREVMGEVTFVSRQADPSTRTYRIEIEVPNPEVAIRDGATADILIIAEGEPAHLLPQSALTLDDAGRLGIRVVEDDRARFLPVRILRDEAEGAWLAGLPDFVEAIVVGQEFVTDGTPVAVTRSDGATQ